MVRGPIIQETGNSIVIEAENIRPVLRSSHCGVLAFYGIVAYKGVPHRSLLTIAGVTLILHKFLRTRHFIAPVRLRQINYSDNFWKPLRSTPVAKVT